MTAPPEVALSGQTPCALCRQPAAVDRRLCHEDIRRVQAALDPDNEGDRDTQTPASIPVYWARLDASPGRGGDDGRRAPGFRSTPPCNLHVVAMRDPRSRPDPQGRDDVAGEPRPVEVALANLARGLWDHLDLQGPDLPNGDVTAGGVPGLSGWLYAHALDLTAHPDAGPIAEFLAQLVEQLRVAAGDPRDKPVGRCIEMRQRYVGDTEVVECGSPLYMPPVKPPAPDQPEEPVDRDKVVMRCRACDRPYRIRDLVRLRLVNQRDEQEAA